MRDSNHRIRRASFKVRGGINHHLNPVFEEEQQSDTVLHNTNYHAGDKQTVEQNFQPEDKEPVFIINMDDILHDAVHLEPVAQADATDNRPLAGRTDEAENQVLAGLGDVSEHREPAHHASLNDHRESPVNIDASEHREPDNLVDKIEHREPDNLVDKIEHRGTGNRVDEIEHRGTGNRVDEIEHRGTGNRVDKIEHQEQEFPADDNENRESVVIADETEFREIDGTVNENEHREYVFKNSRTPIGKGESKSVGIAENSCFDRNSTNVSDDKWLKYIEKEFQKRMNPEGGIDIDVFSQTLGLSRDFFCERVFHLFDKDDEGTIPLSQLMKHLEHLTNSSTEQTLQFLFSVYDSDGVGELTRDGLQHVMEACIEDSSLSLAKEQIEDLTDVLFDESDVYNTGTVSFAEFNRRLEQYHDVKENLCISVSQWLKQNKESRTLCRCPRYCTCLYIRNHLKKVVYLGVYLAVNIILFITAAFTYRNYSTWVQICRGSGQCLNFNCMWVLVVMLRYSITLLRSTKLRHILPLDQHISFHKITGYAITFFSLVHITAHTGNAVLTAKTSTLEVWEILLTTKAKMGHGILTGSAYITGWLLALILVPMVVCSMSFIRRTGHFQVFYLVHLLYVPFWILLLMHGSNFWKWFLVPGAIFVVEKICRSKFLRKAQYGDTWIKEVNLLPSKVTHLVINRPEKFEYKPGDYIFIQIPAIAKYEWHPFTLSSAPEMEGTLWVHARSVGNWTNKLYEYFDELEDPLCFENFNNADHCDRRPSTFATTFSRRASRWSIASLKSKVKPKIKNKSVSVKCYIDGPYGTCARELLKSEHAVLIGAGIGVTPMASVLQSVWYKFNDARVECPCCQHTWYFEKTTNEMKLKKVDFIWVNRDQKNFEWFLTLLSELEIQQASYHGPLENTIQTHLYMTSAKKKTDLKGIGLQMALDLAHEKNKKDLITGLRAKTKPGRPDWDLIFRAIKEEKKGKVKVYFCGPPALGKTVKEIAMKYNMDFSKESF